MSACWACGTRQLVLSGHQRSRWGSCPVGPVMGPMAGTLFTHFRLLSCLSLSSLDGNEHDLRQQSPECGSV